MNTKSFKVQNVYSVFCKVFRYCGDMHEIQYPEDTLPIHIEIMWKAIDEDIYAYLDGISVDDNVDWENDYNCTLAVVHMYIDFCRQFPEYQETIEQFWEEQVMEAIQANAEYLFDADGPCDIYGNLL